MLHPTSITVPPTGPVDIAWVTDASLASVSSLWPSPLATTWPELIAKSISVGRWHKDLFKHGTFSAFEAWSRAFAIWAYLEPSKSGSGIRRSALYEELDPSEKSGISYLVGMTTAAIAADVLLGAKELLHVGRYAQAYRVVFATASRPDLFGPMPGGWLVVEAKGRSGTISQAASQLAVSQKAAIASINGAPPALSLVSLAHFVGDSIALRLNDPPPTGISLDIEENLFLQLYYEPIADLIDRGQSREILATDSGAAEQLPGRSVTASLIPELDIVIGLDTAIYQSVRQHLPISAVIRDRREIASRQRRIPDSAAVVENSSYFGADGVAVTLGEAWHPDNPARGFTERP